MARAPLQNILWHLRHLVGRPESGAISDRHLLALYAGSGDADAFAALVDRHGPMVLGVCQRALSNHHDAEDAFQAVFVILARKAGEASWQETVGPWLHEVAHRVAMRAKARALCQKNHERRAADMRPSETQAEPGWTSLREVLDEELRNLPIKYRAPVLLCYLEGKSNEQAAEQLGWPTGTVKSRLARGRQMLQARLTRRGLPLSAALLASCISQNASAAVPAALVERVNQAALLVAAGQVVGGLTAPAAVLVGGTLRAMGISKLRTMLALVVLFFFVVGTVGWITYASLAAGDAKPEIVLPKDPKSVVLSMSARGGMVRNASPDPYLQVQADGTVILTERTSGAKKTSKLTPAELQELLRFVIQDNDFCNLDPKQLEEQPGPNGGPLRARVTDGTSTTIRVDVNDKPHEIGFYVASMALGKDMDAKKPLVKYATVEWRLYQLAFLTSIAPANRDADQKALKLPKDAKAVVLSLNVSHNEIPTIVFPNGGKAIGSPRADQLLEIQADGKVRVTNRISNEKKETQLTAVQLQDLLRFVIQENEFFKQKSVKLTDKENPAGWKLVLNVQADEQQHEVSIDGHRPEDFEGKTGKISRWLENLARGHVSLSGSGWQY